MANPLMKLITDPAFTAPFEGLGLPVNMRKVNISSFTGQIRCVQLTVDKLVVTGENHATATINCTKSQLDDLIATNSLVPGTTYIISGVDAGLYDDGTTPGTTVVLIAVTNNQLSLDGAGLFYNPLYNQSVTGFGIWSNISAWSLTSVSGLFNPNENVTADNGATGYLIISSDSGRFVVTSGDWTTATTITGDSTGVTASISSVTVQSYNIGDQVIYGGYSWTNLTGFVGTSYDVFNLDNTNWSKDTYFIGGVPANGVNTSSYASAVDLIKYDYNTDKIIQRRDNANNDVQYGAGGDISELRNSYPGDPIAAFQFGNPYNNELGVGLCDNLVVGSYVETINFAGGGFTDTSFTNYSFYHDVITMSNVWIWGLVVSNYSGIAYCIFTDGFEISYLQINNDSGLYSIYGDIDSSIGYMNLNINSILGGEGFVQLSSSNISQVSLTNNSMMAAMFLNNSWINNVSAENNSFIGAMTMNNSYMQTCKFHMGGFLECTLTNSNIIASSFTNYGYMENFTLSSSSVSYVTFNNSSNIYGSNFASCNISHCNFDNGSQITLPIPLSSNTLQFIKSNGAGINVDLNDATICANAASKDLIMTADGVSWFLVSPNGGGNPATVPVFV